MEGEEETKPQSILSSEDQDDKEDALADPEEDTILYELLVFCEWHQEPRLEAPERPRPASLRQWAAGFWQPAPPPLPEPLSAVARAQPAWQLSLSPDSQLLAVLQDGRLEVRAARDNFTSVAATCAVQADPRPQWRRLRWAAGRPLLAVAASSGRVDVLDALAAPVCAISPAEFCRPPAAVAELAFAPPRRPRWDALLLVLHISGYLAAHHVSSQEGSELVFTFSFKLYPRGITSATYDEKHQLLVVAGESSQVGCERLQGLGSCEGITCWRLLADFPHLKVCQSLQEQEVQPSLSWLPWRRGAPGWDPVLCLSVSPDGRRLCSAHLSGALTVWEFPALRKQSQWPLEAQPGHDAVSPELLQLPTGRRQRRLQALGAAAGRPSTVSWWSEAALIVVRLSGAVTVSSAASLANLLGESAEFFSGVPRVSSGRAAGAGHACLVLECERRAEPARRRVESGRPPSDDDEPPASDEDEDEPIAALPRRLLDGVRAGLYWLTDSERFEPARRLPRLIHTLYRLTCLRSTTPQQLYARKIELGEYGEALMLAEAYNLDSDLAYLRQWQKSDVTADSIREFLGRIRRRTLVLTECVSRVPARLESARLLLQHGLAGTELEAVLAAADPADHAFRPSLPQRGQPDLPAQEPALRERPARRQLLAQLSAAGPLTPAQRQLLEYRSRLLGYRERLCTYEQLLGGPETAAKRYDPAVYSRFRDRTALQAALEFARRSEWQSVEVMLTYHGHELLSHRLLLLSNFPETTLPTLYAPLLPEVDANGRVIPWETIRWEEPDWVDSLLLDEDSPRHRSSPAECPPYVVTGRELTPAQLTAWYAGRAREVVARSCLIGHGLDLVQLGRERNVAGLEPLRDQLDTLATLVYDAGQLEETLDSLAEMPPERVVQLMMADTSEATFVAHMRGRLLPYLERREVAAPGSSYELLRGFVLGVAADSLALPELLVRHSVAGERRPLLADADQLTRLALDAVYACQRPEEATAARRIASALPAAASGALRARRERLAARLAAVELLAAHGQCLTPAEVAEVAADAGRVHRLLERLSRAELRQRRSPAEPDRRRLLDDMLEMQQKVFQVVSPQTCHEIFVLALLTSSRPDHIQLAGTLICTDPSERPAVTNVYLRKVPHQAAARLVVDAAAEYFDASASLVDPSMELARQCLELIKEPPEAVRRELGLVDSLEYLVAFGVSLLPVQVRLTPDKLTLLEKCLDSQSDAYRSDQDLLKLSQLLHIPDNWRLMRLIAGRALQAADPAAAARACRHLVVGEHTSAWDVCQQVAECDDYTDVDDRLELLSFSLAHCPPARLERLLRLRQRLLAARLCQALKHSGALKQSADAEPDRRPADGAPSREASPLSERDTGAPSREASPLRGRDTGRASPDQSASARETSPPEDKRSRSPGDGEPSPAGEDAALAPPSGELESGRAVSLLRSTRGLTGHIVRATASTTRAMLQATSDTTRAVLQATSDGTRALVSGQLPAELLTSAGSATRTLLRSTVTGLSGGRRPRGRQAARRTSENGALLRLGVPAFSAALLPGCHESALEPDYRTLAKPAGPDEALRLALAGARLQALAAAAALLPPAPPEPALLLQLVPALLAEDAPLALAWALLLPDGPLGSCLDHWPQSELALRLAAYCCALRASARRGAGAGTLRLPPPELVAAELGRPEPDVAGLRPLMERLGARLEDARQARQLRRLDRGVDVARFASEPAYQRDTILGLAMSDEDAALAAAGRLARRYGVSAAELALAQLVHLFAAHELSADELRERVRRRDLMTSALQEPAELAAALRERVLPALAGSDHERLLLGHTLLARADPSAAELLRGRVTLLQLVRGSGADFHRLLAADGDELAAQLSAALSADSADQLQELAPQLGNPALTGSAVAAAWVGRTFYSGPAGPWRRRLEEQRPRLQLLTPDDFVRCAGHLLFSDAALKLDLETRQQMARRLREVAGDRGPEQPWAEVRQRLDAWIEHLEYLEWDSYTELLESADDDVYRFARLFDQTRGEAERLRALRLQIVLDGCHLSVLRQILSVFPLDEVAPVEAVLLEALRAAAARLRGRRESADVRPLAAAAAQIKRYIEAGGQGLTADQVIAEFRQLCDDPDVDASRRVKAARLLTKHFPVDRDQFPALVHADTAAVLPGLPLTAADTRDAAGRARLLARLAAEAAEPAQLEPLLQLLRRWPPFPAELCADPERSPLCVVCERALRLPDVAAGRRLVLAAAAEYADTALLPAPAHGRLAALLAAAPGGGPAGLRAALLSHDPGVRAEAVNRAAAALEAAPADRPGWPLAESSLDTLLAAGALPLLVGTALYEPAVERLLKSAADPLPAAAQLRAAGHEPEAAALLLRARAARPPASHASISAAKHAASKVFSKWLQ